MKYYCEDAEKVLSELGSAENGLTQTEAERRLNENGKNKLAEPKKDSLIKRFLAQMADPMILILLAAAAISGVLAVTQGESFADVIIILFVVIVKRRAGRLSGKQGGEGDRGASGNVGGDLEGAA